MKTDDVLKALEQCVNGGDSCGGCPLIGCFECRSVLLVHALDTINSQNAEIADLEAKKEICAEVIARQDKEIEKLSKSVDNYESCLKSVEVIRVNAIKEFAERLNIQVIPQKRDGYTCDIVLKSSIDNLVKEMTEAQNATHNNSGD